MTLFQIVIYIIATLILLSVIATSTRKKKGSPEYRKKIDSLKERAEEELKGLYSYKTVEIYPFLDDRCNAFLICRDRKKDLMSVVTEEKTYIMKNSIEKACDIQVNNIGKNSFDSVICNISSSELEKPIQITFASCKHRTKGYLGKSILENAEFFKSKFLDLN